MVGEVRNQVVVVEVLLVELEATAEDFLTDEEISIGEEEVAIEFLGDLSTILNGASHQLHGVPLIPPVNDGTLSHVLLHVEERGVQVGGVELVGHRESDGTESTTLLYARMQEADGVGKGSPLFIGLDLLKEVLVDHGRVSTVETGLHSLWWLESDLDGHLEETKREVVLRCTSDPNTELVMYLDILRVKDGFHFSHEFKRQMTVVKDNPFTCLETVLDLGERRALHLLSHGGLLGRELLEFTREVINGGCWVSTSRQQVEDGSVGERVLPDFVDLIRYGGNELVTEHARDEFVSSDNCTILTDRPDKGHVEEVTNGLVGVNLVLVVGDMLGLGVVTLIECTPLVS